MGERKICDAEQFGIMHQRDLKPLNAKEKRRRKVHKNSAGYGARPEMKEKKRHSQRRDSG